MRRRGAAALWRGEIQIRCAGADAAGRAVRGAARQIGHTLKASGARPKIFLANLGTAADFTARATFAKSFFETGGIEAIDTQGFADPAALAAAFKASGAAIVRLCSSDKAYAEHAAAAAKALQAANAKHIYLAGRPGEQEAALRSAGVGDFIFAGGDAASHAAGAVADWSEHDGKQR